MTVVVLVLAVVPVVLLGRLALGVWRFARLPRQAKWHYLPALWAKVRWRWLTRNLGLAYIDQHRKAVRPVPFGTSVQVGPVRHVMRFPRARIRADAFGLVATVKTVPKTGRNEFEKSADYIADAWKCHRVQVSQPKPGRLIVRGLRIDPLTLPFGAEEAPAGVFDLGGIPDGAGSARAVEGQPENPRPGGQSRPRDKGAGRGGAPGERASRADLRVYLGRDEWAADRWLPLRGLTGITVGGLPGYGKTSLVLSLLMQLAALPVQFVFIDGKGGGDYADWADRAWLWTGDELPTAAAHLEDVHALMRNRFGTVLEQTGHRNAWRPGPSEDFPLIVTVIDECHTFFDTDAVKGDHQAEKHVRACRTLTGQLVRKGRSVLMLTVLITQKQTGDAIPTAIRDNCGFGVSFAARTRDAAVAALGDQIREHSSFCPTTLQDPAYVGVCTAALRTGQDPFVRLRVPEVTEEAAAARAAQTASKRLDPTAIPVAVPAPDSPPPPGSYAAAVQQAQPRTDVPLSR